MSAKLKSLLCLACLFVAFIFIPSTASSELLWPLKVGDTYKYKVSVDGEFDSYEYTIVTEKISIDSQDYYRLVRFDPDAPEPEERFGFISGLVRSTEGALYEYNPDGNEVLLFQSGIVGSGWNNTINGEEGYDHLFSGILENDISLETPYGACYPTSKYYTDICLNDDHTDCVRELYWITPGLGYVNRNEDEIVGLVSWELADIIPHRLRFFFVSYNRYEDSRENFSFYFGFGTGNDPAEYLYKIFPIPAEDFGLFESPNSLVELFDITNLKDIYFHDMSSFNWNVSRDLNQGFNFESLIFCRINPEDYNYNPALYELYVRDLNNDEYEALFDHQGEIDLPFISANSFVTYKFYNEPNDETYFIWRWQLPEDTSYQDLDNSIGANALLYNGESYIGEYFLTYPNDQEYSAIPLSLLESANRLKLQAHIRMNDFSNRVYSNMISVPIHDEDEDGISDITDTLPSVSSADFSDGTTTGTITDNGGMLISVTDAASDEVGVLLAASCADPSGQCPGTAVIDIDGGVKINMDMNIDVDGLDTGDEITATKGSVILRVIEGLIRAEFTDESGEMTAVSEIGKGNAINFDQEEFTFTAPETNTDDITVEVGEEEITLSPGETSINIDIRPFSRKNIILMWRWGKVPVAILSTDTFYAPDDVNKDTITFGATGEEASPIPWMTRTRDINHDGIKDLICVFRAKDTGFQPEDTIGILKALKTSDEPIKGQDSVIVIGR